MRFIISGFIISFILLLFTQTFALTLEQEAEALNVGKQMMFDGNIDDGIRTLEDAVGKGTNANILLYLAKAYSWKGNYVKALDYYNRVITLSKSDSLNYWTAQFGIAQITSWQKKYDEAITLYTRILDEYKLIPVSIKTDTLIAIGDVNSWKQNHEQAIDYFKKVLGYNPKSTEALNRIAKVYQWSKNYKESKKYCLMVLEIDSNNLEAKNRNESLDLLWNYSVTIGDTLTVYDTKNTKGDSVLHNNAEIAIDWQVMEYFGIHIESSYSSQNAVESDDIDEASKWTSDILTGFGINGKILTNTFYMFLYDYIFDSKISPDQTGEASLSQKITRNFDILIGYKVYYDSKYETQKKQSAYTHSFSAGFVFYFNESIFSQVQLFYDTDGNDRLFSTLFHQTFVLTPRDKLEIYLSYGKGMNYLVYSDTTIPVDITTTGIAFSYVHFLTTKFGLKFNGEYHDRVNYYSDYSAGLYVIYNI